MLVNETFSFRIVKMQQEYVFHLRDFFNYYVQVDQNSSIYDRDNRTVGFYDSINMKREFSSQRPQAEDPLPPPGEYLPHQRFLSRFFSPYTPYDRLLVFHGLGTGKTCLMAAVVEFAKQINPTIEKVLVLVRNDVLKKSMITEIATRCTCTLKDDKDDCLEGKYIGKLAPNEFGEDLKELRTSRNVRKVYDIKTFGEIAKDVAILKAAGTLQETYSNTYIIIDEAHNIKEQSTSKGGKRGKKKGDKEEEPEVKGQTRITGSFKYKAIWDLCHMVKGTKIMLMTGTPMRDRPESEFVDVANLILPADNQFTSQEVKDAFTDYRLTDPQLIKNKMRGKVSYLRSMISTVNIEQIGDILPPLIYTKLFPLQMRNVQLEAYQVAYNSDTGGGALEGAGRPVESLGMWLNSIFASLFVFPNGKFGIRSENAYIKCFDVKGTMINSGEEEGAEDEDQQESESGGSSSRKARIELVEISENLRVYLEENGMSVEARLHQLANLSAKYAFAIRQILENPTQKVFVYCRYIFGGGCLMFAALLQYFGFSKVTSTNSAADRHRRYAIITSTTNTPAMTTEAIKIFNKKENDYGDICQVVIGSHVIGEGVSLKSIRKTFILSPFWNDATIEQAIGRSIRSFSHSRLRPEDQTIEVYRFAALLPQSPPYEEAYRNLMSVDVLMYKTSEDKDIKIKQIERALKESAIDCTLNKNRNILPRDRPLTKACDYLDVCDYVCEGTTDLSTTAAGTIEDTYNLYYADNEIAMIIESIKSLFQYKSAYDFEEIFRMLMRERTTLNSIVLARALYEMISKNTQVSNRHGFVNYVRTDRNMYFLVDDPMSGSFYWNGTYADHPKPNIVEDNFNKMLEYMSAKHFAHIEQQLSLACEIPNEFERNKKIDTIMSNIPINTFNSIIEQMYRQVLLYQQIRDAISEAIRVGEADASELDGLVLTQYFENLYKRYKNSFMRITKEGEEYVVNNYNTKAPRVAKLELLLDTRLEDQYIPWTQEEELLTIVEEDREARLARLTSNPLRAYGVLDPSKTKDNFSVKVIQYPRYKLTVCEPDTREARAGEGTVCGTGEMSLDGVCKLILKIVRARLREERPKSLPFLSEAEMRNLPPPAQITISDLKKWIKNVINDENFRKAAKTLYWNERFAQTIKDRARADDPNVYKQNLLNFAFETVAGSFAADKAKVKKKFGQLKCYTDMDDMVYFLVDNENVQGYLAAEFKAEIASTPSDDIAAIILSQIANIPLRVAELDESSLETFVRDIHSSNIQWNPAYLKALYNGFGVGGRVIDDMCNALYNFFDASDLMITTTKQVLDSESKKKKKF